MWHLRIVGFLAALVLAGAGAQAAQARWVMPPRLTWYWQLQGPIRTDVAAEAYDVDGFETSATEVTALRKRGVHVICYIDAGTAEKWRPDYKKFPKSVLGRSNGWPGERWIDIRRRRIVDPIMLARFRMCRSKGFQAVEPDNIEAYANRSGFPITAAEQLSYNEWIASTVHSLGMAVLQKNDGEQTARLEPYFDGALTEQCNQYRECDLFDDYLRHDKPVLNAEYSLPTSTILRRRQRGGHHGRPLQPRTERPALRTLLVAALAVAGQARVEVHVVPAVGVPDAPAPRALRYKAGLDGDAARRRVRRRVLELEAQQPDVGEAPVAHRA